jgi:hypothetical protein
MTLPIVSEVTFDPGERFSLVRCAPALQSLAFSDRCADHLKRRASKLINSHTG